MLVYSFGPNISLEYEVSELHEKALCGMLKSGSLFIVDEENTAD